MALIHFPDRAAHAPAAAAAGFRSVVVPVNTALAEFPADVVDVAARLSADRRSSIVLIAFTEIPLWEEMDVELPGVDERIREIGVAARDIGRRYGVGVHLIAPRTRHAEETILAEAARRRADLIVLGAAGRSRGSAGALLRDPINRRVSEAAGVRTMYVSAA